MNQNQQPMDPRRAWQPYRPAADAPWDLKKAGHLYRRAAFGATWDELQTALRDGPEQTIASLLRGRADAQADELWATIADRHMLLCFDCIERRLGRSLTQADLTVCAFNAGWLSFDGADVVAMQFARGRRLLPTGEAAP